MIYVHLTFSSVGRLVLFPDEARRRLAVRAVVRIAADRLVLFCVVDDHTHVVIVCEVGRERTVAGAIVRGLRALAAAPIASPHVQVVERRAHLSWLVPYSIDQTEHHGIEGHPALWSGSCFQDLVGARVIGATDARIRTALPRLSRSDFFRMAGLPELSPAADELVRRVGAARIVDASAAAVAADPSMRGIRADVVRARRASAQLGTSVGLSSAEMAWALGITARGVRKLAHEPCDAGAVSAARMQIAIAHAVGNERAGSRDTSRAGVSIRNGSQGSRR